MLAPVRLDVAHHERGRAPRPEGQGFGFSVAVRIMDLAIFAGMSYIFASITGEKQQRVTEQVVSAISPQSWIDGKILGLAGVCLVWVVNMSVGFGLILLAVWLTGRTLAMPATLGDPRLLALMLLAAASHLAIERSPRPGRVVVLISIFRRPRPCIAWPSRLC